MMNAGPIKFLIVDDIEENLVALEALLRRDGLQILCARSGAEALEFLLAEEVALAFLDVQMPVMDGFELAELMRGMERTKRVPIIFVTAGARDSRRVFKGYETGAVDFLFKPIDAHVLKGKADVFFDLDRQRRDLAEALRLNEMFVGILGHDLRNPLAPIMLGAQILESQITDEGQLRTLGRMRLAGKRMTNMIEQLLDLTRARLGGGLGISPGSKSLDVAELVRRAIDELQAVYPDREVRFEASGDCTTNGDPDRLLQLFSNLVGNAMHHGASASPIAVIVDGMGSEIIVRSQNGGVIPAHVLPRIFDPFRGRQRVATNAPGLGLGLYIAQQIAIAHAGSLGVESEGAQGTTFTVRLPKQARRETATRPENPKAPR